MSTNICRVSVAISSLVFLLFGCITVYTKQFGFSVSSGHMVTNAFIFRDFSCGIGINAWPVDKESFSSNVYSKPWFAISSEQDCERPLATRFASITLQSIYLKYGDTVKQFEQTDLEVISACHYIWRFSDIVIPDSVDSLYLNIGLSYIDSGNVINADTVVTLYRFHEQWKDMWSGNT